MGNQARQAGPSHYICDGIYRATVAGVYHEQLAWFLVGKDQAVSVVLPNKAKHYLKSLGHKSKNDKIDGHRPPAQGLAQMGLEQHLPLW